MYSYRIEQAIRAVAVLHQGQERKGIVPIPFATHLYSVGFMLLDYTDDEDVVIAGFLHDTLEDTDYTYDELKSDFGEKVAELVDTLTEPASTREDKLSWLETKKIYADNLKHGNKEASMIAAVDKIHNFRSMVEEYYHDHNRFLKDFGKNLDERIEAYQHIANVINKKIDGPLLAEFNHVFDTYKEFIYAIKQEEEKRLYL